VYQEVELKDKKIGGIIEMKRVLTLVLTLVLAFSLAGCLNSRDGNKEIVVTIPEDFADQDVSITFWHTYGQGKSDLLDAMIADFEVLYPNVTVDSKSQGNYTDLLSKTRTAIGQSAGEKPDVVVGYPDHFAEYMDLGGIIPLDKFIEHETYGVDLTDYQDSYVAENQQYAEDGMYSMPYSKSTEMMVYNKTKFDALGITFEENEVITWEYLETIADTVMGEGENQCEFLINYDSSANLFINSSRQWGAGYTNSDGEVLIDNAETRAMLTYYQGLFNDGILALPMEWEQNYGSQNFLLGDVCMTVGSTAGISYNNPADRLEPADQFEIGILPIPQFEGKTNSAMQQGPNIAILESADDYERLASWLLIKHLTNEENTADWAIDTGYLPVTKSGYNSDVFQDFLSGQDLDYLVEANSANAAYAQITYNNYDPAFAGIGKISSAKVREEAGYLMEAIYAETKTIDQAIQDMINQLSW
jgi:multiple sugar transport system substrate-binding protein